MIDFFVPNWAQDITLFVCVYKTLVTFSRDFAMQVLDFRNL